MVLTRWNFLLCLPLLSALVAGCSSGTDDLPSSDDAKPFQLGNLLEPFDPPPLEEILAGQKWTDQPVVDGTSKMRALQQQQGPPPLTETEALALRNDSDENNDLILRTLGQLAPGDGSGVDDSATMVRKSNSDLKSSNPLLQSALTEAEYHALTGIGLFGYGQDFKSFADANVVASWQTSEDHLIDKIVLRDDLTWSDGTPVTAHDFQYAFQTIMTDEVIVPSQRSGTDQLKWVQAYDDHTLVFFHKEPLATNVLNMAFSIIPKHIYEKTIPEDPSLARSDRHSELEDHPIVGGAYELVKRVRGQEFVVRRRESYYMHNGVQVRAKPHFAEVRFKVIGDFNTALLALKKGELQESELTAEQWASQTSDDDFYRLNTKATALEWTSYYLCWNMETPFFSDKRVRQAMSYALDYEEMLSTVYYDVNRPSQGIYHPDSWMAPKESPKPYQQDLSKAEALLDEAGWVDSDGDGFRDKLINGRRVPFRFTLMTSQSDASRATGILLKEGLNQIGVDCILKPTEFTVLVQRCRDRKFQAFMGAWITGTDPDMGTNLWTTGKIRNYSNYSNPIVDELFVEARREIDREKRAAIYGKIHHILWEDQPYTWLLYRNSLYGFNKKLRGYNFSPSGPYQFSPGFFGIYMHESQP